MVSGSRVRRNDNGHVALYIGSLQMGGAEHVMVNLAEALFARGWRVTLVTTYLAVEEYPVPHGLWKTLPEEQARGSHILQVLTPDERRIPVELEEWKETAGAEGNTRGNGIARVFSGISSKEAGGRLSALRRRLVRLDQIWEDLQPDVILSFIGKNNLMALLTAHRKRIPVIVSVRAVPGLEYPGRIQRLAASVLFGRAAAVAVQTAASAAFFPASVRKKAVVMPNAVSREFLSEEPVADRDRNEEEIAAERERTVVAVGRMDANKRFDLLLRAFARIIGRLPGTEAIPEADKYRLLLYGDGEDRPQLEELAKALGIADHVRFMGRRSGIAGLIRRAGAYCLMSDTEGMPNTLIEAMCLGIPSVTTDCIPGGMGQLLTNGEDALVVPTGDEEALAAALRRIFTDRALADSLSVNARKMRSRYDPDRVTDSWEELLANHMKQTRQRMGNG